MSKNWARLDGLKVHHLVLQTFTQLRQAADDLRILADAEIHHSTITYDKRVSQPSLHY